MKLKILLSMVVTASGLLSHAQKNKQMTAYAITGAEKGQNNWSEVRLVNIATGEVIRTIYQNKQEVELLNARTGQPIVRKDIAAVKKQAPVVSIDRSDNGVVYTRTIVRDHMATDVPFATNSAAMAYDKKHERLYYTPMGINQLRYIDLKSGKIYYFENEAFGVVKGRGDVANQITRMVIASDGDGYALSNDGNHLIKFTTGRKAEITDLGALTDASGNTISIHQGSMYGGDVIADAHRNIYLITANRQVFLISLESRQAHYLGNINGLPRGYTTNGAFVEGGSSVIVASASSTEGYYRFDLKTLQAEKVSGAAKVFNASDLASGTLASVKEKKKKNRDEERKDVVVVDRVNENPPAPLPPTASERKAPVSSGFVTIYPNPVTNGVVRLSFTDQPPGKYQVQFMDISGKVLHTEEVTVNNRVQVQELKLPPMIAKGNYLLKVSGEGNRSPIVNKLIIE